MKFYQKLMKAKAARVAVAAVTVAGVSTFARAVDPTALPTFSDTVTSVSGVTGTYLLPGMAAIAGIGGVVWLYHRVTGKFTHKKA